MNSPQQPHEVRLRGLGGRVACGVPRTCASATRDLTRAETPACHSEGGAAPNLLQRHPYAPTEESTVGCSWPAPSRLTGGRFVRLHGGRGLGAGLPRRRSRLPRADSSALRRSARGAGPAWPGLRMTDGPFACRPAIPYSPFPIPYSLFPIPCSSPHATIAIPYRAAPSSAARGSRITCTGMLASKRDIGPLRRKPSRKARPRSTGRMRGGMPPPR
jgi:hypothetical protein